MKKDLHDFSLTEEEQSFLNLVREICVKEILPVRAQLDENEEFPRTILDKFRKAGVFGAMHDPAYGGAGLDGFLRVPVAEVVGEYCLAVATSLGASVVLAATPLAMAGTKKQKEKYLTRLISGESIGSFCVTEPDAGSNTTNLSTVAEKDGDVYRLNGTKQWITNAGQSDIYIVFARTDDRDGKGLSSFIVEKGWPGLSFGPLEKKMGIRASHTRQVIMQDLEVPAENLIGLRPNRALIQLMDTLNRSRAAVAGSAVGVAVGAFKEAVRYVREREQFGNKVISFQAVRHLLSEMQIKIEAARMLAYKAGRYAGNGHPMANKFSAMAKSYCAEVACAVTEQALFLHGGYGFVKDYPIEKMFRDTRILSIYEGTAQMQKEQVATYIQRESLNY